MEQEEQQVNWLRKVVINTGRVVIKPGRTERTRKLGAIALRRRLISLIKNKLKNLIKGKLYSVKDRIIRRKRRSSEAIHSRSGNRETIERKALFRWF